jgi:type I restriction enzyme S subunit
MSGQRPSVVGLPTTGGDVGRVPPHGAAPTGRKKIAQGKERNDDALGNESQNTSSPEGAKEITSLPAGWTLKTVGELAANEPNSITDGPFGSKLKTEHYTRSGPRVIRLTNIGDGEFVDAHAYISDRHFATLQKHRIFSGDIVIAALGEKLPRACLIPETVGSAIVKADCIRFKPSEKHSPKFLYYALNWEGTQKRTASIVHGVGRPRLNLAEIKSILLPIAPLSEQRRIVAEIEKQFTRLEAGVAALRRVQANLKRYRAAVLKAACEGRLVSTEAELAAKNTKRAKAKPDSFSASSAISAAKNPGYETGEALLACILTERRQIHERAQAGATLKKKYREPKLPSIPPDGQLSEGWTWATWDQIGFSQNGRPFPSAEYREDGFKLLRPGNLHVSGKVVWTESNTRCMPQKFADENPDLIVRGGELVMNLTAQSLKDEFLGRVCITGEDEGCLLNQRLARLTSIIVLPEFVLYLLKAWRFRRYVDGLNSGSLIQHMFTSQLAEFTFPLPPLAEQTRIVAEVERRLSVVEELEAVVYANLQRATRLRQSILQKAFTGRL